MDHPVVNKEALLLLGVPDHPRRLMEACMDLDRAYPERRLRAWAHMLGFRGHFSTKSRCYSPPSAPYARSARTTAPPNNAPHSACPTPTTTRRAPASSTWPSARSKSRTACPSWGRGAPPFGGRPLDGSGRKEVAAGIDARVQTLRAEASGTELERDQ
ncbi:replication initiator [Streptomyces goshikiensis]|uniref:replication initiator n=1 Tax=Streptomyces goshikiensis TaxID=1942 RepID=UPI003F4B537C